MVKRGYTNNVYNRQKEVWQNPQSIYVYSWSDSLTESIYHVRLSVCLKINIWVIIRAKDFKIGIKVFESSLFYILFNTN